MRDGLRLLLLTMLIMAALPLGAQEAPTTPEADPSVDASLPVQPTPPAGSDALSLKILENYRKVMSWEGGLTWLDNLVFTGSIQLGKNERLLRATLAPPERWRTEAWINVMGYPQKETYATNGETRWMLYENDGKERFVVVSKEPDQIFTKALLPLRLLFFEANDMTFRFAGQTEVGERKFLKLETFEDDRYLGTVLFDSQSYLPVRFQFQGDLGGVPYPVELHVKRFQREYKLYVPREIIVVVDGRPFGNIEFKRVFINSELDAKLFQPKRKGNILLQKPTEDE